MAVYTSISEDLFKEVLTEYSIGNYVLSKGIAEGVENTNYLLETTDKKFIATCFEKRANLNELPFFFELMEHLSEKNIPCPVPIHGNDNNVLREVESKPFAIVSFLQGRWPKKVNAAQCEEVGKILAQMHNAVHDFSSARENTVGIYSWRSMYIACLSALDQVESNDSSNNIRYSKIANEIEKLLDRVEEEWPKKLPSGVIHGDLFPDNVFFKGDSLTGVLDFYFACTDFLVYDLAIAMNAWCFESNAEFNITRARRLLRGYNKVRPLSDGELKSLPILCSGAALRFLLTRLYDALHQVEGALVTVKDPDEYLQKLRFHLQVKSHGEYGL